MNSSRTKLPIIMTPQNKNGIQIEFDQDRLSPEKYFVYSTPHKENKNILRNFTNSKKIKVKY